MKERAKWPKKNPESEGQEKGEKGGLGGEGCKMQA